MIKMKLQLKIDLQGDALIGAANLPLILNLGQSFLKNFY
jgi:hypothetical protein